MTAKVPFTADFHFAENIVSNSWLKIYLPAENEAFARFIHVSVNAPIGTGMIR